jgi:TetR/AcrR family transcriptional repressor of nem operon
MTKTQMRYPKEHKARTRQKIVETAAREFRDKGLEGVGVADLMASAGLTHGGFYAHFGSKEALVEAACRHGVAATIETLDFRARQAPPGEGLRTVVRTYLSRAHRDDPARGCIMPSLAGEIARHGPETRRAFTDQLRAFAAVIARQLSGPDAAARERRALAIAAGLVGAVALARAVDDPALSDAILEAARAAALEG